MAIKSSQTLVSEALQEIKTISTDAAHEMFKDNKCNLIDIRDSQELKISGSIENAVNISRGLLEFGMHSESPLIKDNARPSPTTENSTATFCRPDSEL